jgi:hypothetical protein
MGNNTFNLALSRLGRLIPRLLPSSVNNPAVAPTGGRRCNDTSRNSRLPSPSFSSDTIDGVDAPPLTAIPALPFPVDDDDDAIVLPPAPPPIGRIANNVSSFLPINVADVLMLYKDDDPGRSDDAAKNAVDGANGGPPVLVGPCNDANPLLC